METVTYGIPPRFYHNNNSTHYTITMFQVVFNKKPKNTYRMGIKASTDKFHLREVWVETIELKNNAIIPVKKTFRIDKIKKSKYNVKTLRFLGV